MKELREHYYIEYTKNKDIRDMIETIIYNSNTKKVQISNSLNISRSRLDTFLNKKNINMDDLKLLMDLPYFDYEIQIHLYKRDSNALKEQKHRNTLEMSHFKTATSSKLQHLEVNKNELDTTINVLQNILNELKNIENNQQNNK